MNISLAYLISSMIFYYVPFPYATAFDPCNGGEAKPRALHIPGSRFPVNLYSVVCSSFQESGMLKFCQICQCDGINGDSPAGRAQGSWVAIATQ